MENTDVKNVEATRNQWMIAGPEMEYGNGLRAVAADKAIRNGITDLDSLYEACMTDVGENCVIEDFDYEQFDVAQGSGLSALQAYLDLYRVFGAEWLILGTEAYFAHEREVDDPQLAAHTCVKQAQKQHAEFKARDLDAVKRWLIRAQGDLSRGGCITT